MFSSQVLCSMNARKHRMEQLTIVTVNSQSAPADASKNMFAQLEEKKFFSGTANFLLLSGGSCIEVARQLLSNLPTEATLSHTVVGLADERWVDPGSADSNEQQLREAGVISLIEEKGGRFISMISQSSDPTQAAAELDQEYKTLLNESEHNVLLAGVGEDGHTLGILPEPEATQFFTKFSSEPYVLYYELSPEQQNPFRQRITTTFSAISKLSSTFIFGVGESKRVALTHLNKKDSSLNQVPALGLYLTEHQPLLYTDLEL